MSDSPHDKETGGRLTLVGRSDDEEQGKARPSRSTLLARPPEQPLLLDYAKARHPEALRRQDPTPFILELLETESYEKAMLPSLDWAEERRLAPLPGEKGKRGRPGPYTVHEIWLIEAAYRQLGFLRWLDLWGWLTGDFARNFRKTFGFDQPRENRPGGRPQVNTPDIPSLGVLGSYRRDWFPDDERAPAWMFFETYLFWESFDLAPEQMKAEMMVSFADGSVKETHHTCPQEKDGVVYNALRKDWATGEYVPNIFCPEGGYIGGNREHAGNGFNFLHAMSSGGRVYPCWDLPPLHHREPDVLEKKVVPGLDVIFRAAGIEGVPVLTADSGFNSPSLRRALRKIGVVENIHISSHSDSETTDAAAAKRRKQVIKIHGHPNWYSDGHRKLWCVCGCATLSRRIDKHDDGSISVRVEGDCKGPDGQGGCGNLTITAGRYHKADRSRTFRKARPGEDREETFGNFFTYDDHLAKAFGDARHSCQEGFLGSQLTERFHALDKRWIRRKSQGLIDISSSLCFLTAASIRGLREQARSGAPPDALAA